MIGYNSLTVIVPCSQLSSHSPKNYDCRKTTSYPTPPQPLYIAEKHLKSYSYLLRKHFPLNDFKICIPNITPGISLTLWCGLLIPLHELNVQMPYLGQPPDMQSLKGRTGITVMNHQ